MQHEIHLRLPSEMLAKIVEISRLEDRSINKTVKRLLEKALANETRSE